jgi:hypothetical protein
MDALRNWTFVLVVGVVAFLAFLARAFIDAVRLRRIHQR